MKPRRTHRSNQVFRLEGGTEDNDLWVRMAEEDGLNLIESVWEPSEKEREALRRGANVKLTIFGTAHPPAMITTSTEELGRRPDQLELAEGEQLRYIENGSRWRVLERIGGPRDRYELYCEIPSSEHPGAAGTSQSFPREFIDENFERAS